MELVGGEIVAMAAPLVCVFRIPTGYLYAYEKKRLRYFPSSFSDISPAVDWNLHKSYNLGGYQNPGSQWVNMYVYVN